MINKLRQKRGKDKSPEEAGERNKKLHVVQKKKDQEQIKKHMNKSEIQKSFAKSTGYKEVKELYDQNKAEELQPLLKSSEDYLKKVTLNVPMNELYEVLDYLFVSEEQLFCPVIIEVKIPKLANDKLNQNAGARDILANSPQGGRIKREDQKQPLYKYLLQLWRHSDGQLLYERKLRFYPIGWGIKGQNFFYQEENEEDDIFEIYHVTVPGEIDQQKPTESEAFFKTIDQIDEEEKQNQNHAVQIKKIILPRSLQNLQEYQRKLEEELQFKLPDNTDEEWKDLEKNNQPDESESDPESAAVADETSSANLTKVRQEPEPQMQKQEYQKVLDGFIDQQKDNIKLTIPVNMTYITENKQAKIVLASTQSIIEITLKQGEAVTDEFKSHYDEIIELTEDDIKSVSIQGYKFCQFVDIGQNQTTALLENRTTCRLRFLLMTSLEGTINYEVLGIVQKSPPTMKSHVKSQIVKVRSVQGKTQGPKPRSFLVCIVLRNTGLVEVYSDFELSEYFNLLYSHRRLFCVDIETDEDNFYFRYLKLEPDPPPKPLNIEADLDPPADYDQVQFEIHRVSIFWRRKISFKNFEEFHISDWTTIRLKKLNNFMKLYTQFLVFNGLVIVAHRNFISVFKASQHSLEASLSKQSQGQSCWVQHEKVDNLHHIVSLSKEKARPRVEFEFDRQELPTHAVTPPTLFQSMKLLVILSNGQMKRFSIRNSDLPIKPSNVSRISLIKNQIIQIYQDPQHKHGTFLRTTCGTCNFDDTQIKNHFQNKPTHRAIWLRNKGFDLNLDNGQELNFDEFDHLVFEDFVEQSRKNCSQGSCHEFININYGKQVKLIDADDERKDLSVETDFEIVSINKKFWKENGSRNCSYVKALEEADKEIGKAILLYKKQHYIKLVPFLRVKEDKQYKFEIMQDDTVQLLDKKRCTKIFDNQKLIFVNFVNNNEFSKKVSLNSFVILTQVQISVFDHEKHEVARISQIKIGNALLLDQMFLYIMEDRSNIVYQQYASKETEWELSEPTEIDRNCKKEEEGLIALNFVQLFQGKFSDLFISIAATGHNGQISRCTTSDTICMMNNLHSLTVIPIPHWNLLSFTGMGSKSQYLIWKASTDGFFTALSKSGCLRTWSCITGRQLWVENQNEEGNDFNYDDFKGYDVYRADRKDNTYLGDYYNFDNPLEPKQSYSLSLLVSRDPVNKEESLIDIERCIKCNHQNVDLETKYHTSLVEELINQTGIDKIGFEAETKDTNDQYGSIFGRESLGQNKKADVNFKKKMHRMKLYHFQVLKLYQFEDKKRYYEELRQTRKIPVTRPEKSKVTIQYHFFHKLLDRFHPKKDFEKFDWFLDNERTQQRLYLSRDTQRMCEVIKNRIAVVWNLPQKYLVKKERGQLISWERGFRINQFPFLNMEVCSLPYFMSDDFEIMCDYNYHKRCLRILRTNDQCDQQVIGTLPELALYKSNYNDQKKNVLHALSCVKFEKHQKCHQIVTYNQENGLYTEWPISKKDDQYILEKQKSVSHMMKILEDMFQYSGRHILLNDGQELAKMDISQRIIGQMVEYKLAMSKRQVLKDSECYYPEVYKPLMAIDYNQNIERPESTFQLNRAFTLIDWKNIELLEARLDFQDLESQDQLRLMFSVFPQGTSLLQMLATTSEKENTDDFSKKMDSQEDCDQIFKLAIEEGYFTNLFGDERLSRFNVPLLPNCMGLQPLDYAMGSKAAIDQKERSKEDYNYKYAPINEERKMISNSKNLPLVQAIFAWTKQYTFMHTNPVKSINQAIREQLPQAFEYLDARLLDKASLIENVLNTKVQHRYRQSCVQFGEYGIIEVDGLTNPELTQSELFFKDYEESKEEVDDDDAEEEDEVDQGQVLKEQRKVQKKLYDYYWFDIPQIHQSGEDGYTFMQAVQMNENVDIYSNRVVQILVVKQWLSWKAWNTCIIMIPLILQLIVYTIFSCFLLTNLKNVWTDIYKATSWASFILAIYFILLSVLRIIGLFVLHYKDIIIARRKVIIQVLMSLISPIMILIVQLFTNEDEMKQAPDWYWELIAWTAFILWITFTQNLRHNKSLSTVISMVEISFSVMRPYLIIVIIGVLAFTNSFITIRQSIQKSENQAVSEKEVKDFWDWKDKWFGEYIKTIYEMFVGGVIGLEKDENAQGFTDSQMILFAVSVIFNMIVLMNLLLAVVGSVQNEVEDKCNENYYKMLVDQICLLQCIFFLPGKKDSKEMLFLAKPSLEYTPAESLDQNEEINANQEKLIEAIDQIELSLSDLVQFVEKQANSKIVPKINSKRPRKQHPGQDPPK